MLIGSQTKSEDNMKKKQDCCPRPCFKEMDREEKVEALIKSQCMQMDAYTREFKHLFKDQ